MKNMIRLIPLGFLVFGASPLSSQIAIISWGPSNEILDNRFISLPSFTLSDPAGTINGDAGVFRYRSHTTAVLTVTDYDNAPISPNFGVALAAWRPTGGGITIGGRIEGRDANTPNGDFIQISNSTSNSTFGANMVWWELAQAEDATARTISTQAQVGGGTATALMARQGTQWYIANPAAGLNVADITTIAWVAYNPVDGSPVSMFANNPSGDTVGELSALTFSTITLNNITAMGLYQERIGTNSGRSMGITEFTVIPEPRVYAALFGLFALGFVAWRRRR